MAHFYDLTKLFTDRLSANYSGLPVIGNNDDGKGINKTSGFLQVSTVVNNSVPASINGVNPKIRTRGMLEIQIHTLDNTGEKTALQLADTLSAIFRNKSFNSALCFSPFIDSGRKVEYNYGNFYVVNWYCSFQYDEHIAI